MREEKKVSEREEENATSEVPFEHFETFDNFSDLCELFLFIVRIKVSGILEN